MSNFKPYERIRIKEITINDTKVENCQALYIKEVTHNPKYIGKSLVRINGTEIMINTNDISKDNIDYES